jgi:tetratricopeptide (TPR) repeat protein
MARVARDTGKTDLFREILERLLRIAPHDEGVRRLAQQTGSIQAPPPYGTAAMQPQEPPRPVPPQASAPREYVAPPPYPQQPPAVWGQQQQGTYQPPGPAPQPPQPSAGHPLRPNTQPFQRPQTEAYGSATPLEPEAIEEVQEVSYSAYEEVEEVEEADLEGASYGQGSPDRRGGANYGNADAYDAGRGHAHAQGDPNHGYGSNVAYDAGANYDANANYSGDDVQPLSEADSIEQVQKTLADANAFRRVRLYAKALETLRAGLEFDPRSMDLHEVYRDVLIESGETDEAVQEMLVIASLYVDALDGESAARALQDVLAFDPQNARAIEMLQELGYEIVDENEDLAAQVEAEADAAAYSTPGAHDRLPSYDLEEMGPADISSRYADDRQIHVGRGASQVPGYDDGLPNESLPSFPLDEPDAAVEVYADADDGHDPNAGLRLPAGGTDSEELSPPAIGRVSQAPPQTAQRPSLAAAASRELEDALDEAEFFCSRGLYDDAKAILTEQLAKHPNNPLLRERLAEVDSHDVQRGSGARERPQPERAFDIAASLDALENLDYDEIEPAEGHAAEDQQVDVEEVFAKFKEGVAKQISVEDSDSHYNLGIAYKEMLLLDDAIREFDVAAMDPKRECVCRSMIGMIQIERGNINEAIEAFLQGLNSAIKDPSQETVLCYEIGAAYEAKKMTKDALSYYQKAMRRDPNYRDVQERVRRLAKAEPKQNLRQVAVGADDEFDRAFDDLLSKA